MNRTAKSISIISILLFLAKIFALVREMTVAKYYGVSGQTDAYNMAFYIIDLSTAMISITVATIIIPMYSRKLAERTKDEADYFANNILWITCFLYGVISLIGIIFAPFLIKIFAPDFNSETSAMTINMIRMMFIFTIGTNIVNYLSSVSKTHQKYSVTALVAIPMSIATIISIVFLSKYIGIYALVVGFISYTVIQVIMLIVSVRDIFKFKFVINFINGDFKEVVILSIPILMNSAVWQINGIVSRILASGLTAGSISAMDYANKIRSLPDGIISAAILTVIFPILSKYAANKDYPNVKILTTKSISLLFLALMPIIVVSLYYNKGIIKIIYERGAFTPDKTAITAHIFVYTIISLIFIGGVAFLNSTFYSMQDTKTPRNGGFIYVGSNIILNLILVRYMQAAGLALATSISYFLNFVILFIQFRRKCGAFGGLLLLKNIAKCLIAAACMIPVFFLCELIRNKLPLIIFFGFVVIISFAVYALILYLLKAELFIEALNRTKSYLIKSKNK